MTLSRAAKERGLKAIVATPVWPGLATSRKGGSLTEVGDLAYRRQPVTFAEPSTAVDRVEMCSAASVQFPPWATDSNELKEWFLIDSEQGDGTVLATGAMEPRGYVLGDEYLVKSAVEALETGRKDAFLAAARVIYPRPLAGEGLIIEQGKVILFLKDLED